MACIAAITSMIPTTLDVPVQGPRLSEQGSDTVPANCVVREQSDMYAQGDESTDDAAETPAQCAINQPKWI